MILPHMESVITPSLAGSFEHTQVGKGSKDDFVSFCLGSGVFPVAELFWPLSSNMIHQRHTDSIFSATAKPLQSLAISFSSSNTQSRLHGSGGGTCSSSAGEVSSLERQDHKLLAVLSWGINLAVLTIANRAGVSVHPPQLPWELLALQSWDRTGAIP